MVEHAAVNRRVAGSSPARGAVGQSPEGVPGFCFVMVAESYVLLSRRHDLASKFFSLAALFFRLKPFYNC